MRLSRLMLGLMAWGRYLSVPKLILWMNRGEQFFDDEMVNCYQSDLHNQARVGDCNIKAVG
jgi:hypothetical protein